MTFNAALSKCVTEAQQWFLDQSMAKTRQDWCRRGGLGDRGKGAVYAFFDASGQCLYVGQTTSGIKKRANYRESRHYSQVWWCEWVTLRFVPLEDQTDQMVLEILLILGFAATYNTKPRARDIAAMFPTQQFAAAER